MKTKEEKLLDIKKKVNTFKIILIVYGSVILLMCIIAFVTTQKKGISFLTFLPLFFLPMEILNYYQLKKALKQIAVLENE